MSLCFKTNQPLDFSQVKLLKVNKSESGDLNKLNKYPCLPKEGSQDPELIIFFITLTISNYKAS
jgi:hypothetical protein